MQRHRHQEFIPSSTPRQLCGTETSQGDRLARSPLPHHAPDGASWLNAVEGFFAMLTKRGLKRGTFVGIVDLQAAINRYVADHNTDPKPFGWKANPDKTIAAAWRYNPLAL
jgi:hypothetical protein